MPKILSVIIPTCNRLENLKVLLRSLERQRLPGEHFDIFVVDDGSTDGTASFLAEKGVPFVSTTNGGPARARNLGAGKTASPLLAFIDDDAEADPDWLSAAEEAFRRGLFKDAAEGDVIARGEPLPLSHCLSHTGPGGLLTCNFVVTRECFGRCGGFDERFRYPMNEDFEFFIRLRKQAELVYVPGMKVYHPVRPMPFWRTFCGAVQFARRRVSADFLLMEIHPQEYRQVKFARTAQGTLRRAAFRYFFSSFFAFPGSLLRHPWRALMWAAVCAMRQKAFFYLWLTRYRG